MYTVHTSQRKGMAQRCIHMLMYYKTNIVPRVTVTWISLTNNQFTSARLASGPVLHHDNYQCARRVAGSTLLETNISVIRKSLVQIEVFFAHLI